MKKQTTIKNENATNTSRAKKAYKMPRLKVIGRVTNLTLKSGSSTDGFGTFK